MRTNIELDDQLVKQAMRCCQARTKGAVVEAGLRLLVQTHSQTSDPQAPWESKVGRESGRIAFRSSEGL